MNLSHRIHRRLAPLFLAVFGLMSLVTPIAQAGMISTPNYVQSQPDSQSQRQTVEGFLQRDDVAERLTALGVDPLKAQARAAQMTDQEVAQVAHKIDSLPAGGDSLIGALVFIFIVLLITDILGFTDVFPFVKKSVR